MAVDIRFLLDGEDRGQPSNADDFGFTITEDIAINARIVSYDNDLNFTGGVYEYLFNKLDTNGFCNLINVEVQYLCAGVWKKLVNGYIVLSECKFNLDICQVVTKVYDESFSTKINNNKSIPFSLSNGLSKNLQSVNTIPQFKGRIWIPVSSPVPAPNTNTSALGVKINDAFRYLISCMSDNLIDFESNFFETDIEYPLFLTNGSALAYKSGQETIVSFDKLYIALKKKFNLGIGFETQSNGRPLLRIELISYFYQQSPSVNLYDQPLIDLQFDKERLYQAVAFGSDPMAEKETCNNGETPCQFLQTPFRGFRDETFGFTGECNTSNILELKSDDIVFDTNVIEDIWVHNNEEYKLNPVIIEGFYGSDFFIPQWFDPYGIGQSVFNGNLRNINVSANWISGYPNSLYSFLTAPFDPATTIMSSTMSDSSQSYPIGEGSPNGPNFNTWFRYSDYAGNWLKFLTQTDPYNLFDGESYTCPYLGTYTINSRLCFGFFEPIEVAPRGRKYQSIITHLNGNGDVIEEFFSTFTSDSGNLNQIETLDVTFICNQGDLIRIDARVQYTNALSYPPIQRFLNTFTTSGGNTFTPYFNISATALNPNNPDEELQPINIEDVRAYLYNFERPLTMTEIEQILDNTSRPISFGRFDDPLRVINGYIKKLEVKSIIEQEASFELKSNKILR